jgi:hypothetical protein
MPNPTQLPPHVRRLVDEIESEIGETDVAADEIVGSLGRQDVVHDGWWKKRPRDPRDRRGPGRQGLLGTPERVHRMHEPRRATTSTPTAHQQRRPTSTSEMVVVSILFYSFCEHHLLPFLGRRWRTFRGRVIGLEDPAFAEMYARRLQVQERRRAGRRVPPGPAELQGVSASWSRRP